MIWVLYAILAAFFRSLTDVFSKKGLRDMDEYIVAWSLRLFALIFLLPLLFFIEIPSIGTHFWTALIIGSSLNIVTTVMYMKALKASDLSITVPLVALTPLFLLITSPLMVGEFPNVFGLVGVLLIVIGSYTLKIREKNKGFFAPFKALLKENGPRYMLAVAFIWSITSNFDKIGIQNSSPLFWVIAINFFLAIVMIPLVLAKSKKNMKLIPMHAKSLILIGLFSALHVSFHMLAINLTLVAYVISIKRISTVISVFFGWWLFREKGIKERLLGTAIMIAGVILITLS